MKWLDALEERLDSKLAGSMEVEADLSRRRILTVLALNLATGIIFAGVGYVVRFTLGPAGLGVAILVGFGVAYGLVGYVIYRYIQRRRRAPSPAPTLP